MSRLEEYGTEEATFLARKIASEWHGGQWSPFYAFSSSGHLDRAGMLRELETCDPTTADDPEEEAERLALLREVIEAAPEIDDDDEF